MKLSRLPNLHAETKKWGISYALVGKTPIPSARLGYVRVPRILLVGCGECFSTEKYAGSLGTYINLGIANGSIQRKL
jgi:hypothetical protein